MPVPRRRSGKLSLAKLPGLAVSLLNVDFVFQKTKTIIYWGFAPAVILIGLRTEPRPGLIDLFNIWE